MHTLIILRESDVGENRIFSKRAEDLESCRHVPYTVIYVCSSLRSNVPCRNHDSKNLQCSTKQKRVDAQMLPSTVTWMKSSVPVCVTLYKNSFVNGGMVHFLEIQFIDKVTRWNSWLAVNELLGESKYFIIFYLRFLPFV